MKDIQHYQRIMIIGSPGSGKSTLAHKLAGLTQLPLIHLDSIQWIDDQNYLSSADFKQKLAQILSQEKRWIIDGNYNSSLEMRMDKADLIIHLQFPRWLCIYRIFKRFFSGNPLGGNPKRLDFSFIKFVWNFPKENQVRIRQLLEQYDQIDSITLTSSKQIDQLLKKQSL